MAHSDVSVSRPERKPPERAAGLPALLRAFASRRALWPLLGLAGMLAAAAYLAQNWRATPSAADDGLILDYIHQMALGQMPHFDMVDAYGVFNWVFPVTFYKLAGMKIWGVRLWLVLLKLISVALAYRAVSRLTTRVYGLLAALGLTLLLGQPWQAMQTAYAFLTVTPCVLGAWYALVARPSRRPWLNAALAAACTTIAIWTKLNTGLYLFAGGALVLLVWPSALKRRRSAAADRPVAWLHWIRALAAALVAGAFCAYVSGHFAWLYVPYLLVPLALALGCALATAAPATRARLRADSLPFVLYCGVTLGLSAVIVFGYYGIDQALVYAEELSNILAALRYESPFPPLGKPLIYVGLNENYWLQLPWLLTALFGAWLVLQRRFGPKAFGAAWPEKRAQAGAIFLLATLHAFVLFPRSDDMHLFQALLLAVPALFVILWQLEAFVRHWQPIGGRYLREGVIVLSALYASTIAVKPSLDVFELTPGDYAGSRFEYLNYRSSNDPYVKNFDPTVTSREWDTMLDATGRYIDSIAEENEPILVMSDQRLLHALSSTSSVGGRYAFYFYLVSTGLLDRKGFDAAVPGEVVQEILNHPPRVVVAINENNPLVRAFPEFKQLRDRAYVLTKVFRYVRVYELRPTATSPIALAPQHFGGNF